MAWLRFRLHYLLFATSLALTSASVLTQDQINWTFAYSPPVATAGPAKFETVLDMRVEKGVMHSPHIVSGEVPQIMWFQGSAEAVADVEIWSADYNVLTGKFSEASEVFDASALTGAMQPRQPVLALGNTIQSTPARQDRFIGTILSAGGWAASSIAQIKMRDGVPVYARKLPLSPFLNRSNLVRNGVAMFGDTDIAVPAYHEMAAAFGLLVRLGPEGRVRATSRMGFGKTAIQPELIITGPQSAVALMRPFDGSGKLYRSETIDGGQVWSLPIHVVDVANPDAPVAAVLLSNGSILMAANNSATSDRSMSLMLSKDGGQSWKTIHELEDFGTQKRSAVRYPDMERLINGDILLTYSVFSKRGIRAITLNETWVNAHE